MKRNRTTEDTRPDRKSDRDGWKAQLRTARRAKSKRRDFEARATAPRGWK